MSRYLGQRVFGISKIAVVLLVVLVAAACSSSQSEQVSESSASVDLISEIMGENTDKFDATRYELTALCMKEQGFEYERPTTVSDSRDTFSLEYRQEFGYGISHRPAPIVSEMVGESAQLSAPQTEAHGAALGQCLDEAQRELDLRVEKNLGAIPEERMEDIWAALFGMSPELSENISNWSKCLAEEGFSYQMPLEIQMSLEEEYSRVRQQGDTAVEQFQQKEINLAVAELKCYEQHVKQDQEKLLDQLNQELADTIDATSIYDE